MSSGIGDSLRLSRKSIVLARDGVLLKSAVTLSLGIMTPDNSRRPGTACMYRWLGWTVCDHR